MAINLAKRASDKVVERFRLGSCTEGIFSTRYKWTGVATVQVYSVDRLPLQDYDRAKEDGSRFGKLTELGDTVQELTVSDDKAFNGSIDKGNNTSQLMIKAAPEAGRGRGAQGGEREPYQGQRHRDHNEGRRGDEQREGAP